MNPWLDLPGFREAVEAVVGGDAGADDGWLDSQQAAEYLAISRGRLHNLVSQGKLPRHGARGHALRFRRVDLDAYVADRGRS